MTVPPQPPAIDVRDRLSYDEFVREYLFPNKPVIVTGALDGWTAKERWTPEFFKTQFADMPLTFTDELRKQAGYGDGTTTLKFTMREFIDCVEASSESAPAPYLRNIPLARQFPSLVADIQPLPRYFFPNWLGSHFLSGRLRRALNRGAEIEIYIGGCGGTFPVLHFDGAMTHAFLMQIYGRKAFVVFPPDQTDYVYPAPESPHVSTINSVDTPDLTRFPLFAKATPIRFVLEPGQLLFVPSGWWHTTKMLTTSITVSINTVNRSNWWSLVRDAVSRQSNPLMKIASTVYLGAEGLMRMFGEVPW